MAIVKGEKRYVEEELKSYLEDNLPEYMIPLHFINVDKIDLTANGKVDMKSLMNLIEKNIKQDWISFVSQS